MIDRCRLSLLATLLSLSIAAPLLGGCATVYEARLDPTQFPRTPAEAVAQANARVGIIAAVAAPAQFTHERKLGMRAAKLVIPVQEILSAATVAALSDELGQSLVQYPSLDAATGARNSASPAFLVAPQLVRFEIHDEYIFIPLPYFSGWSPTRRDVRLLVDCRALNADGKLLWSRSYDSGSIDLLREEYWPASTDRQLGDAAHREAYKLMRRAARDFREWLEAERLRERVL